MPIYEYKCTDCEKVSEFLVGVVQAEVKIKCAHCGSKKLKKIFSESFISTKSKNNNTPCGRPCDAKNSTPPCAGGGFCNH